jgi:tRNA1Val (adenine37-N6)-methyltransferase
MSNSYFQFKQFTIHQDRCAMKVCTDACLFGAWVSRKEPAMASDADSALHKAPARLPRMLDIGSGTGLLMLMLAQRQDGLVHGIELDPGAFGQSRENIAASPWAEQLQVFQGDARQFAFPGKYDLIISNPPFFEDDLPAATETKNLARHSQALKLSELMAVIESNLESAGYFGILLPYRRTEYFLELAAGRGFYLQEQLNMIQQPGADPFRSILHFSRMKISRASATGLVIRKEDGSYTEEFVELMKDYYLYL